MMLETLTTLNGVVVVPMVIIWSALFVAWATEGDTDV